MILHGRNIIINVNGSAVAAAKSCSLNILSDTIETVSPTQGNWKEFISDRKEWSVTLSHLLSTHLTTAPSMVGTTVEISLVLSDDSEEQLSGSAICTEWKLTATLGNLAQGSFSFKGTGALE